MGVDGIFPCHSWGLALTTTDDASVAARGLCRRYGRRWALSHVNLDLPQGSGVVVTGGNGSGKSTLLRCLATALRPHAGTLTMGGKPMWTHRERFRPHIGYMAHQNHLWMDLSAQENLLAWAGLSGQTIDTASLLEQVGLSAGRRDPVRTFSAGMKRRLAVARMLIRPPRLLLLDEPFSGLDASGRADVAQLFASLRAGGTTLVVATHLPQAVTSMVDRCVTLEEGRVTSDDVFSGAQG